MCLLCAAAVTRLPPSESPTVTASRARNAMPNITGLMDCFNGFRWTSMGLASTCVLQGKLANCNTQFMKVNIMQRCADTFSLSVFPKMPLPLPLKRARNAADLMKDLMKKCFLKPFRSLSLDE
jgi:hypothetical protein